MSGRRGRGEGTVYRYRGGWAAQVSVNAPGAPRRRRTVYGQTQRAVLAKVEVLDAERARGMPLERSASLTVGAYLENWVTVALPARVAAGQLKDSTLDGYRDTVTHHLLPGLGRYPLASLSPQHLRAWQSAKLTDRSVHGRPLSSSSVKSYHAVLRSALSDAMRDELVDRNVAMLVRPARPGPSPSATLTGAEAGALLAAVTADPLRPLWLVLLVLGCARGRRWRCGGRTWTSSVADWRCADRCAAPAVS